MSNASILIKEKAICLIGSIDFNTVVTLNQQVFSLLSENTVIDLGNAKPVDSAGIALFCDWKRRYRNITFTNIPKALIRLIALSGVTNILC